MHLYQRDIEKKDVETEGIIGVIVYILWIFEQAAQGQISWLLCGASQRAKYYPTGRERLSAGLEDSIATVYRHGIYEGRIRAAVNCGNKVNLRFER